METSKQILDKKMRMRDYFTMQQETRILEAMEEYAEAKVNELKQSNVMLSLPSDEIAQKAIELYKDINAAEYNAFLKGAAWMSMRLIDEHERGNGA